MDHLSPGARNDDDLAHRPTFYFLVAIVQERKSRWDVTFCRSVSHNFGFRNSSVIIFLETVAAARRVLIAGLPTCTGD